MFKSKLLHLAVSVLMSFEIESWEIYRRAREKHIAIGESDRMTLKFVKPDA